MVLEPQALLWALIDLQEKGEVTLLRVEDVLHLMREVESDRCRLLSCRDGWRVRLEFLWD